MDNNQLVEQVVKKARTPKDRLIVALILFGTVMLPLGLFAISTIVPYLAVLALFVLLFSIYGAWFFITSLKVEFEYAFLSSTMRIDKIIAKRRRKKLFKIDVKQIDDFFRYSDDEMDKLDVDKVFHAEDIMYSDKNYVITFNFEKYGKCAAVFSPNEQFLEAIKPYCSFEIRKKFKEYGL